MLERVQTPIIWNAEETPDALAKALRVLGKTYPIYEASDAAPTEAVTVKFKDSAKPDECQVTRAGHTATVHTSLPNLALRAVSALMAGLIKDRETYTESTPFKTFGIMLDCSRNAVMTAEHFKTWLRTLALLGYNMAMLYTEDTYELPGEPYFGYLRGAYTAEELRDIDAYAAKLGVEMIPCIQTLGHLEQILKWPAYRPVKDTTSVVLVDEEKTYELIEKMLAFWSDVFGTRRVHIGMDETHDLGRGNFMDRFGYERGFDIFNRHLGKVVALCEKHSLEPMIWSDMYFRLGSKTGDYYDPTCDIPQDVIEEIPPQARLVYWDYYHPNKAFYLDWIARHRNLGSEPIMASGVWTWPTVWYDRFHTEANALPCIEACLESNVEEILFTLWGDDGEYCDFDSAFAGLALAAEKAFTGDVDEEQLANRFKVVYEADYKAHRRASDLHQYLAPAAVLWDDPLLGLYMRHSEAHTPGILAKAEENYRALMADLDAYQKGQQAGDLNHAKLLVSAMAAKVELERAVTAAYASHDTQALCDARVKIPDVIKVLEVLAASFRTLWLSRNKPLGLEVIQIRFAGQVARYKELDTRLGEYLAEEVDTIPELDAQATGSLGSTRYHRLATASFIL